MSFPAQGADAQTWKEHKARHFIIFYNEAPLSFVETVERAAERYYDDIHEEMNFRKQARWTYDERVKIYIYDSQEDYVGDNNAVWSHGVASPTKKIIRTFPTAHGFFDSTLPHELGHIIFRDFIGYRALVPKWLEEGVAMYQEQAKRFGSHEVVRKALEDGTFIPLEKLHRLSLRGKDTSTVQLFYAESASLVNFLITEHGKHRFVRFCRKIKDGERYDKAFSSVYIRFKTLEKLNKAWVDYVLEK